MCCILNTIYVLTVTCCMHFVYFNQSRVVEHRHIDIGLELQPPCSVPPVETTGIMLPDEEYLPLLRSLNLRQREFFNYNVQWIKYKDEPIYAFWTGVQVLANMLSLEHYQSLYIILNLRDGENPADIRILICATWALFIFYFWSFEISVNILRNQK